MMMVSHFETKSYLADMNDCHHVWIFFFLTYNFFFLKLLSEVKDELKKKTKTKANTTNIKLFCPNIDSHLN